MGTRSADQCFAALWPDQPSRPRPVANYVPAVLSNGYAFLSGHGPLDADARPVVVGRLGGDVDEVDVARGAEAARLATMNMLASLRAAVGSLDDVAAVSRLTGYLRCAPGFTDLDNVIEGSSEVLREVFGADHARTVYAVTECVFGLTVTVDAIFSLREETR